MTMDTTEAVNMFGHHPDLSTDFCIEVEMLQGWICDIAAGLRSEWPFWARLGRLLQFCRTGAEALDEYATRALPIAQGLERDLLTTPRQSVCLDMRYNKGTEFAR